jgi:hypothetical protein
LGENLQKNYHEHAPTDAALTPLELAAHYVTEAVPLPIDALAGARAMMVCVVCCVRGRECVCDACACAG